MANTPLYIVEATISQRASIEPQIIEAVAYHCRLTRHWAEVATANAIVELVQAERIEMFHPGPPRAYKLTQKIKMEKDEDRERRAKEATTKRARAEAPLDRLIRLAKAKQAEAQEREGAADV